MRKITILLLCCGLTFCSACNKAEHSYIENQSTVSETTVTEQIIEIPTEEEKETVSIENTPTQSTTTVINEPLKEETKIIDTSSNTSSITEITITEEHANAEIEIADSTEVEKLVIKYINEYRVAHGTYSAASGRTHVKTTEPADEGETSDNIIDTVYVFDDDGELINEYFYSKDTGNVLAKNDEENESSYVSNVANLLSNHNFLDLTSWNKWGGSYLTAEIINDSITVYPL